MSTICKISRRRFLALTGVSASSMVLMGSVTGSALAGVLDMPQGAR